MLADLNRPFTPTKEFGNKVFDGPARYFEIEVGANLRRATGRERRARVQLVTNERGIVRLIGIIFRPCWSGMMFAYGVSEIFYASAIRGDHSIRRPVCSYDAPVTLGR